MEKTLGRSLLPSLCCCLLLSSRTHQYSAVEAMEDDFAENTTPSSGLALKDDTAALQPAAALLALCSGASAFDDSLPALQEQCSADSSSDSGPHDDAVLSVAVDRPSRRRAMASASSPTPPRMAQRSVHPPLVKTRRPFSTNPVPHRYPAIPIFTRNMPLPGTRRLGLSGLWNKPSAPQKMPYSGYRLQKTQPGRLYSANIPPQRYHGMQYSRDMALPETTRLGLSGRWNDASVPRRIPGIPDSGYRLPQTRPGRPYSANIPPQRYHGMQYSRDMALPEARRLGLGGLGNEASAPQGMPGMPDSGYRLQHPPLRRFYTNIIRKYAVMLHNSYHGYGSPRS